MKRAVLTLDIEDWYHLDYFPRPICDTSYSLLDGTDVFLELLREEKIPSTCFALGELATPMKRTLQEAVRAGHELGSHGWNHLRPLTLSEEAFVDDLRRSKSALEETVGCAVHGYRAPCFSLDRARLDLVAKEGYGYDSSRILFNDHPLYGAIHMDGFERLSANIFRQEEFFEFQLSTLLVRSRNVPVSGGGYLRILPWGLMRRWIGWYLKEHELYVLYIHPFELSRRPAPGLPAGTRWRTRCRFLYGRSSVAHRLRALIRLLRDHGFQFTTFGALRRDLQKRATVAA